MKQLKNLMTSSAAPVADEALFNRMLSLECRRCERTGMPFALVLLEFDELNDTLTPSAMQAVASSISAVMRETDITGWYESPSTIGIILTTLNGMELHTLESV